MRRLPPSPSTREPGDVATTEETDSDPRWWRRPGPSLGVLSAILVILTVAVLNVGARVGDTLPEVGRDDTGTDAWKAPLAVQELQESLVAAVVPDCAAGPITRIVLWDPESEPYWEISGPARPLREFLIGFPVEGFTTDVEFTAPPDDEYVRLVAFRRVGSPIGLRFRYADIRSGRLMGGSPLRSYTKDGWLAEAECAGQGGDASDAGEPTEPGGPVDADGDPDADPGSSADSEVDADSGDGGSAFEEEVGPDGVERPDGAGDPGGDLSDPGPGASDDGVFDDGGP